MAEPSEAVIAVTGPRASGAGRVTNELIDEISRFDAARIEAEAKAYK